MLPALFLGFKRKGSLKKKFTTLDNCDELDSKYTQL